MTIPLSLHTEQALAWRAEPFHHLVSFDDPHYPLLLKEIKNPPQVLYVKGNLQLLASQQLAIVGTRKPTASGAKTAHDFAMYLAKAGFTITSGLALGIDYAAHTGALAVCGKTIGVAGTGLLHCYPKAHQKLVDTILEQEGAIISEFPLDTPPRPPNFPRRNRIISGLAMGVLVVEAAVKSGSLVTARHAIEQDREVFAIPGSIHQPQSRGCHALLRQGAKLVETASDILEELGGFLQLPGSQTLPKQMLLPALSVEEDKIFQLIEQKVTPIDLLILQSGLTASKVSSILLSLELDGFIATTTGGYVRVCNQPVETR